MINLNKSFMMVQDIFLIMKLNVFSKEHGIGVKKCVGQRHFQMEMFMKVNIKMDNSMVEVFYIIMFNFTLIRKGNTYMMDNLSKDKNMVLVKNVTSQEDVMKVNSSIIKNMEMANQCFVMDPIMLAIFREVINYVLINLRIT